MGKKRRQIILIIFELIVIAGIALFLFLNIQNRKRIPQPIQKSVQSTGVSATAVDSDVIEHYEKPTYSNILLVGLDARNQAEMRHTNSDTVIIASINNLNGAIRMVSIYRDTLLNIEGKDSEKIQTLKNAEEISDEPSDYRIGRYDKINAAYANGGIEQLISAVQDNLDIEIDDYIVVNFSAVAEAIEELGGIDVWMTKQEIVHMNNYCVETSDVTGMDYEPIEPDEEAREYHLNGVQAVSYARIRYTAGSDMKRTQRQRVVIQKVADKLKESAASTAKAIVMNVLPNCLSSIPYIDLASYAANASDYTLEQTTGFPFVHIEKNCAPNGPQIDPVIPVTLETNVEELHKFLFNEEHVPSLLVRTFSYGIKELSGITELSMDSALQNSVIQDSGGEADIVG